MQRLKEAASQLVAKPKELPPLPMAVLIVSIIVLGVVL